MTHPTSISALENNKTENTSQQTWNRRKVSELEKEHLWISVQLIFYLMVKIECFPLRSETRQGYSLLALLFNIEQKVLVSEIKQAKDIKVIQE